MIGLSFVIYVLHLSMRNASAAFTALSFTCSTPPSLLSASLPNGSASDRSLNALMQAAMARVAELEDGGEPRTSMVDMTNPHSTDNLL